MTQNEHTPEFLKELQAMPMEAKVYLTQARLSEFYTGYNTIGYGNAYISFSGGKDSTVLLDIARKMYLEIPAVFSNTGLEYPEIRRFAKAHDNVEVVQPKIPFNEVISRYGYPLIGKEVAEAIYYARKIRSQDIQVEREREQEDGHLIQTSASRNRRTVLMGAYPLYTHTHTTDGQLSTTEGSSTAHGQRTMPPPQIMDAEKNGTQREPHGGRSSQPKSRGEWQDWRRGCL